MDFKKWMKTAGLLYLGYAPNVITNISNVAKNLTLPAVSIAASIALLTGCANSGNDPDNEPKPITVNLTLENHLSELPLLNTSIDTMTGETIDINIASYNLSGVSKKFGVVLNSAGTRIAYTYDGTLKITIPLQNAESHYHIILFDTGKNNSYEALYENIVKKWQENGSLPGMTRNRQIHREDRDGRTGPEEVWTAIFGNLNFYLSSPLGSAIAGNFEWKESGTDNPTGFRDCKGAEGEHGDGIWIDPEMFSNIKDPDERLRAMQITAMAEAWERYLRVNNIFGRPSQMDICVRGQYALNDIGVAGLRFG